METFDVFPSTAVPLSEERRDADGRGSNVIRRIATCSSDRVRMDRALPLHGAFIIPTLIFIAQKSALCSPSLLKNKQLDIGLV